MRTLVLIVIVGSLLLSGCPGKINEGITSEGIAYRGSGSPKLVLYEYSDFECPFCGKAQTTVDEVLRTYPEDVQLQFKHMPLVSIHPRSYDAALAAVCAEKQGKFWEMHDRLYENQRALEVSDLEKYAEEIGLDKQEFDQCFESSAARDRVESDLAEAASKGMGASPTFAVGQSLVIGAQPLSKFRQAIDSELARLSS